MNEEEFVAWCDEDTDAEFVDGEVIMPTPASIEHEDMATWLCVLLRLFVELHGLGLVLGAGNSQVRLRPGLRRNPDLIFLSKDRMFLRRENDIDGAPDLIVEFVSPESTVRDWHDKFRDYEAAGVLEYWIVDPQLKRLDVYALGGDRHFHLLEESDGKIFSKVLSGFWIKLAWFWQTPLLNVYEAAREIGIIA
jgi:Uma2 family endonuclease